MEALSHSKQLVLNLVSSVVVFATTLVINFFLSPYIVETIGVEANGFVTLANDFVAYASLITIALNSMASRFITIELQHGDADKASRYYTSVFFGNLATGALMLIPAILCIRYLNSFVDVAPRLVTDVRLLFSFIFLNFFISTCLPNWSMSFFATNKLYIQSAGNIVTGILRMLLLLALFSIFSPHVYYVGIAAMVVTVLNQAWAAYNKHKLLRHLQIKRRLFEAKKLFELVAAGVWNSITQLGTLLLSGLDLLIANIFIDGIAMGILSVAKTVPYVLSQLSATLSGVFAPSLTIQYAQNNPKGMLQDLRTGMKITATILTVLLAWLIAFGREFYTLWQPTLNASELQWLSILSCMSLMVSNAVHCLFNVFTVTNKLKVSSLLLVLTGLLNTAIVFLLLKFTNWGLYAIAGVSSVLSIIRHMAYTIPYAAKYLGLKWTTFYPDVFMALGAIAVNVGVGYSIKAVLPTHSWVTLLGVAVLYGCIGIALNFFLLLRRAERSALLEKVHNVLRKR